MALFQWGLPIDIVYEIYGGREWEDEEIEKYFGKDITKYKNIENPKTTISLPYRQLGYYNKMPLTQEEIDTTYDKLPSSLKKSIPKIYMGGFIDQFGRQYFLLGVMEEELRDYYQVRLPIKFFGPNTQEEIYFPETGERLILYGKGVKVLASVLSDVVQYKKKTGLIQLQLISKSMSNLNEEDVEKINKLR